MKKENIPKNNKTICLPIQAKEYKKCVKDPAKYRIFLDMQIEENPELFPQEIFINGYHLKDSYTSKKQQLTTRRIRIGKESYGVRPSFIMPYMTSDIDVAEKGMFLRKFGVPFWGISHVLGKDAMHWFRMEQSIGRNSIVGTTIRKPEDIPKHLAADEKHTRHLGNKVYIATTVGSGCILGSEVAEDAGEEALTAAYKVFKEECRDIHQDYNPETVNIDGWKATNNSWSSLFSSITIICCFLHVFIKIRDRGKKKYKDTFIQVASKLWGCYKAPNKASFSQRVRRIVEWCKEKAVPKVFLAPIEKMRRNIDSYKVTYDHPNAHRTSNMIDRLMQRMDRHLFSTQYFHGKLASANISIRGWSLIQNFAPSNPYTIQKHCGLKSPAERLNNSRYHDNWLQNLLVSASLGGYRSPPQNPL